MIECFWLEPTDTGRADLRRYAGEQPCPGSYGYHNASVEIGDLPFPITEDGILGYGKDDVAHDDLRWPKICNGCDYAFLEGDNWQHNVQRLYRGAPDGKLYTSRTMPPGAMFNATWWNEPGPDGITLAVVLPPNGGDDIWMPDVPSKDGRPWTRTGAIPRVTCRPSILTPRYHGFLTDGKLEEC